MCYASERNLLLSKVSLHASSVVLPPLALIYVQLPPGLSSGRLLTTVLNDADTDVEHTIADTGYHSSTSQTPYGALAAGS